MQKATLFTGVVAEANLHLTPTFFMSRNQKDQKDELEPKSVLNDS